MPRRAAKTAENVATATTHTRGLGRSFLGPLRTFSSVITLQVTGTFFFLFAAFMGEGVWQRRAGFHASPASAEAHRVYFNLIAFLVFAYFAGSSFVRANRRQQR